jgi:methionyl-tRNA formyltransferase
MKIGFFGTPDIGAYCLESLSRKHTVLFAVTQEDKPHGRSLRISKSAVSSAAEKLGIQVFTPPTLKDESLPETLNAFGADIFVVVAYGKIIPEAIFSIPRFGSINLHPSLLPRYRGAAPVESAILAGETVSGITVQRITMRLDAGDILAQETMQIGEDATAEDMYGIVLPHGSCMLLDVIDKLETGTCVPRVQDESLATYCGKISKESARINWKSPSAAIHNQIRAYNPKPVSWTVFRGSTLRIHKSSLFRDGGVTLSPGEVMIYQKRRILVGTEDQPIEIISLQPENKKNMDSSAFINGYRPVTGDTFS